jgi:O-methyltransferase
MEGVGDTVWDRMAVLSLAPDLDAIRPLTMVPEDALLDLARQVQFILAEGVAGDLVECGVWRGGAALLMADVLRRARCRDRRVWLFDSFVGLPPPQAIDGPAALAWAASGDQHRDDVVNCVASLADVRDSAERLGLTPFVEFVPGWFSETLPEARERIGSIALLRIDADWHASVQCCLEHLYDLVVEGGFVAVDDYYAYDGCAIAVHEFLGRRRLAHRVESVPGTSAGLAYAGAVFRKASTTWGQSWKWMQERHRTAREIAAAVPADAAIVLVDSNQYGPGVAGGRRVVPFLEHHGQYWGPPPDDATAIAEVRRLRTAGATFVVVARPAFWWLEHYTGLQRYLRSTFATVWETEHLVVFDLRNQGNPG